MRDLADGRTFQAPWRWQLELGPYELRALVFPPQVQVRSFAVLPPPAVVQALQTEAQRALADFDQLSGQDHFIPGADTRRQGIACALNEGRLAWLRRALYSYPVRRCRQLMGSGP